MRNGVCALLAIAATMTLSLPNSYATAASIDDALSVQSVDSIRVSSRGALSIETGGHIEIRQSKSATEVIARVSGSGGVWSPDGHMLAYLCPQDDATSQICIWNRGWEGVKQITHLIGGLTAQILYGGTTAGNELAWDRDSRRLAFVSRVLGGPLTAEEIDPKVIHLDSRSAPLAHLDGIFRYDVWDGAYDGHGYESNTLLTLARRPERNHNRLFVIDVTSQEIVDLTRDSVHYFSPSWSPNKLQLAAVTTSAVSTEYPGASATTIAIIDPETRSERILQSPFPRNSMTAWSEDGTKLLVTGSDALLAPVKLGLLDVNDGWWTILPSPNDLVPQTAKWFNDRILVLAADRFVDSLWSFDPRAPRWRRIATPSVQISSFDAFGSSIYLNTQTATSKGVILAQFGDGEFHELIDYNPQLAALTLGKQIRLTWTNASGDELDGLLILPPSSVPGQKYPLIVDVYPFPARDELQLVAIPRKMGQIEAALGYAVFIAGPRSPHTPTGYSRNAEFTEKARGARGLQILVDDFTTGVAEVVRQGYATPGELCVYGASNGGYAANFLITEIDNIKCAVIHDGMSDAIVQTMLFPAGGWGDMITNGSVYDNFDEFKSMSPILRMNRVTASVLMLTGDKSPPTWQIEMAMQFNALKKLGKDVQYVRYTKEGHAFSDPAIVRDSLTRIHKFFAQNLKP